MKKLEEERIKKEKEEEEERKRLELEEAQKNKEKEGLNEEEEKTKLTQEKPINTTNIESTTIDNNNENTITPQKLRGAKKKLKNENINNNNNENNNNNNDSNNKNITEEKNEESIKPKKKKVIKKYKKIVKIPKKQLDTMDNRKPFYVPGSTSINGGGIGHYHENITYTGHIPQSHLLSKSLIIKDNKDKNNKDNLFVCDNCANELNNKNNNEDNNNNTLKKLKSRDYYQNINDDKYDPINTKEFYELNRNRYLSDLWKNENDNKKNIKSRSIEKNENKEINKNNDIFQEEYISGIIEAEEYDSEKIDRGRRNKKNNTVQCCLIM